MTLHSIRLLLCSTSAVLLLALIPACGGGSTPDPTDGGIGGAGGSGTITTLCDDYCADLSACINPASCTLTDPAAYTASCVARCEAGFASLEANDSSVVEACLSCGVEAAAGKCLETLPKDTCKAECQDAAFKPAMQRWSDAGDKAAASNVLCTNGRSPKGSSCDGSSDETSCDYDCSNPGSTTPDVAATCTMSTPDGAAACTCTAGKSKGKTFTATSCSDFPTGDLWNQCNL